MSLRSKVSADEQARVFGGDQLRGRSCIDPRRFGLAAHLFDKHYVECADAGGVMVPAWCEHRCVARTARCPLWGSAWPGPPGPPVTGPTRPVRLAEPRVGRTDSATSSSSARPGREPVPPGDLGGLFELFGTE
jgi:hypothetical protein